MTINQHIVSLLLQSNTIHLKTDNYDPWPPSGRVNVRQGRREKKR